MLAERPHLAHFLLPGGAKGLYHERMCVDSKHKPPMPSLQSEEKRLRRRLAQTFIHIELHNDKTQRLLAESVIPCSNYGMMEALWTEGARIAQRGTIWLDADDNNWHTVVQVIDLDGATFCRPITSQLEEFDLDREREDAIIAYFEPGRMFTGPEPFFHWDEWVMIWPRAVIRFRNESEVVRVDVCLDLCHPHNTLDEEVDGWRMLEWMIDERTTIH